MVTSTHSYHTVENFGRIKFWPIDIEDTNSEKFFCRFNGKYINFTAFISIGRDQELIIYREESILLLITSVETRSVKL